MEKLEADFTVSEYDSEIFRLFGLRDGNSVSLTTRGGLQGSGNDDIKEVITDLRGVFKEFDFGSWKSAENATLPSVLQLLITANLPQVVKIDAKSTIK